MTSKSFLIYRHISPNGKSYIGQTCDYSKRCSEHRKGNKCTAFANAIKKYGWDNFKHEILKDNLTLDEANFWEVFYINYYKTMKPNGYNLRSGGENSRLHKSSKEKIGNANRGRIKSVETCEKISKANTGKRHSEKHKLYMKEKLKGRKFSPKTIEKMRKAAYKRLSDPIYKDKISKGFFKKGCTNSEANKQSVSRANKLRWEKFREGRT